MVANLLATRDAIDYGLPDRCVVVDVGMADIRTVEIGTLRAMGLRRAGIRKLFLCEGFLLGLLGAALGVVIALALAATINHGGLTWTPPGRVNPVPLQIRVWGETSLIAGTAVGLLLVALASAWWPARRAARLNVVEALRHV